MSDVAHSTAPAAHALAEEEPQPPRNPSNVIIWTISAEPQEVVVAQPVMSVPAMKVPTKKPSTSSGQFSSGLFELQDGNPMHVNQREEPGSVRLRIAYSLAMLFSGLVLIVVGVVCELKSAMPGGGVPFWVIGSLLMIPGVYCTWDSVIAFRQLQLTDRMQICRDESSRDGDV